MRVYEVAKKLGIESKDALSGLKDLRVEASSIHSSVSDEDVSRLEKSLAGGAKTKTKKKAVVKKKTTKKAAAKKKATKKKAAKKVTKKTAAKKATKKKAATKKATKTKAAKKVTKKKATKVAVAEAVEPEAAEAAPTPKAEEPVVEAPEAPPEEVVAEPAPAQEPAEVPEPEPEEGGPLATAEGVVAIEDGITVKVLGEKLGATPADVMRELMGRGVMANINQPLDAEVAVSVAEALGVEARHLHADEVLLSAGDEAEPEDLESRPPVVTIMGHVDHGKTLLLDSIRSTNVAEREAGGITQHIGASEVVHTGRRITFIDTPGHEAFTRMRARGAEVTDIVVLVVAADDGVMPQTVEAIDHAKAADVPILVAINKIDRPNANVDRVKQQLAEHSLAPEDWGGDVVTVPVSAKRKENLDDLLEMISLTAEMQEFKASPTVPARGTVLETQLHRQRGPLATLLVKEGTLRVGDNLVVGLASGKVRAMVSDKGQNIKEAGPSTPVEVLGLGEVPEPGDVFQVVKAAGVARKVSEIRQQRQRQESLAAGSRLTLEDLHAQLRVGEVQEMPVVIKADVSGSVEVLRDSLSKLSGDKVEIKVIRAAAGGITESDVLLASTSNAIIVGFNVRPERGVAEIAEREGVELRLYTIIYQLLDEVKQAMVGKLAPEYEETALGAAEVRDTFRIPRTGTIAGCYVTDGKITRDAKVRLLRDSVIIFEGRVGSLRRFKEDVPEVQQGYECGIGVANFNDVKVGDVIEAFQVREIRASL